MAQHGLTFKQIKMAKQIQPVTIWVNGESKQAEYFQVTCINDNYENSATNYWQLFTKVVDAEGVESMGEQVAQGNLTIDGASYIAWGDQPAMAINAWIYQWSADKLNLVILP
jgi:beta-lactamase class D